MAPLEKKYTVKAASRPVGRLADVSAGSSDGKLNDETDWAMILTDDNNSTDHDIRSDSSSLSEERNIISETEDETNVNVKDTCGHSVHDSISTLKYSVINSDDRAEDKADGQLTDGSKDTEGQVQVPVAGNDKDLHGIKQLFSNVTNFNGLTKYNTILISIAVVLFLTEKVIQFSAWNLSKPLTQGLGWVNVETVTTTVYLPSDVTVFETVPKETLHIPGTDAQDVTDMLSGASSKDLLKVLFKNFGVFVDENYRQSKKASVKASVKAGNEIQKVWELARDYDYGKKSTETARYLDELTKPARDGVIGSLYSLKRRAKFQRNEVSQMLAAWGGKLKNQYSHSYRKVNGLWGRYDHGAAVEKLSKNVYSPAKEKLSKSGAAAWRKLSQLWDLTERKRKSFDYKKQISTCSKRLNLFAESGLSLLKGFKQSYLDSYTSGTKSKTHAKADTKANTKPKGDGKSYWFWGKPKKKESYFGKFI